MSRALVVGIDFVLKIDTDGLPIAHYIVQQEHADFVSSRPIVQVLFQQSVSGTMEGWFIDYPFAFEKKEHPSGQRLVVVGQATDLADLID